MQALVSNLVGTGIMPRARASRQKLVRDADSLWQRFAETADADGQTDLYGLQALAARTMAESGEVLVRLRDRRPEDGLPVPLQLQLLEPDHLDHSKTAELPDGGFVLQGVEFDPLGRRRAYWLFPVHPGEAASFAQLRLVSQRVPADRCCICSSGCARADQGACMVAPSIVKLRDLDEYDDAELVRKKIEACFAAFVTGDEDGATLGASSTDAEGRRIERFEPGMIEYLPSGKDVRFATPGASGGYAEYMRVQLHAIAAGVGLTYELLTGDLSQVNYSSIRAGLIEFRRRIEALQWQLLIPGLCQPVWRRFVAVGQATGASHPVRSAPSADGTALRGRGSPEGHPGRHPGGPGWTDDAQGGDRAAGLRPGQRAVGDRHHQCRARPARNHPRHRSAQGHQNRRCQAGGRARRQAGDVR